MICFKYDVSVVVVVSCDGAGVVSVMMEGWCWRTGHD